MIEFVEVTKRFGPRVVLDRVSLRIERGEVFFIIGTSGAGKSVLVKHLVGLLRPDGGRIFFDGEDITDLDERAFYRVRRRLQMVFQHSTLFDSMTLRDNVALPLRKHRGLGRRQAREEAIAYLALVGMEAMADRYPADIGDGLRKRVAIARALTLQPDYMIFDEPTTALDPVAAADVDALIRRLADEQGVTSLVVSHDLRSIFSIADRIAMIYKGRIRLVGSPEAFRQSADPIVRQFIRGDAEGPLEI